MTVRRVRNVLTTTVMAIGLTATLAGCPLILVGGVAAGGAYVATDRRTLGAQTEDREIELKASNALHDNLPESAHFDVNSFNRRVLLTGEVPNDRVKALAEQVVRGVNNVAGIVNEMSIAPPASLQTRSSDTFITSKVQASLLAEKDLPGRYFKVVTSRGTVYLMGLVTVNEGNKGADVASRVPGVLRVVKVFQYVLPENGIGVGDTDMPAAGQPVAPPPDVSTSNTNAEGVQMNTVPIEGGMARPLDQQSPAPIGGGAPVHPGNPNVQPLR